MSTDRACGFLAAASLASIGEAFEDRDFLYSCDEECGGLTAKEWADFVDLFRNGFYAGNRGWFTSRKHFVLSLCLMAMIELEENLEATQ